MKNAKRVHVTDLDGNLRYTRLWDDGGPILTFASGHGFVDRLLKGIVIRDGWVSTGTWELASECRVQNRCGVCHRCYHGWNGSEGTAAANAYARGATAKYRQGRDE
jgi:hypothetical protein